MILSFFPCSQLTEQRSSLQRYGLVFYDQQEDNATDFNSIYIDLTQYLKFFDCFCYCRFLKFHEPFIYTTLSLCW